MKIGFMELVLVFVVALLVIGPDKLPAFAQKLGAALKEFRKASAGVTKDVRENVIEPLEEAQRPIREAMEPLEELDREVRQNFRSVERELKNIGKPAPGGTEPAREAAKGEDPVKLETPAVPEAPSEGEAPTEPEAPTDGEAPAEPEAEVILEETDANRGGEAI